MSVSVLQWHEKHCTFAVVLKGLKMSCTVLENEFIQIEVRESLLFLPLCLLLPKSDLIIQNGLYLHDHFWVTLKISNLAA